MCLAISRMAGIKLCRGTGERKMLRAAVQVLPPEAKSR
jgi:hypothetical protein